MKPQIPETIIWQEENEKCATIGQVVKRAINLPMALFWIMRRQLWPKLLRKIKERFFYFILMPHLTFAYIITQQQYSS